MNSAFAVVESFERAVADYCGAPHAVATSTGTAAIFLALAYERERIGKKKTVVCPARTFISVPMAILQAGFDLRLIEMDWQHHGEIYLLMPTHVVDAALRFNRNMYQAPYLFCLSFHARKILNIGEGGMILCPNSMTAEWLRAARYSGRCGPDYKVENVTAMGWQLYMTPEKAARGLHLMQYVRDLRTGLSHQAMEYPDLRNAPFFQRVCK